MPMVRECSAELAQRLGRRCLGRGEHEAAGRPDKRIEQVSLALPTTAGHDSERWSWCILTGEPGQLAPLEIPVEHILRLVDSSSTS